MCVCVRVLFFFGKGGGGPLIRMIIFSGLYWGPLLRKTTIHRDKAYTLLPARSLVL